MYVTTIYRDGAHDLDGLSRTNEAAIVRTAAHATTAARLSSNVLTRGIHIKVEQIIRGSTLSNGERGTISTRDFTCADLDALSALR